MLDMTLIGQIQYVAPDELKSRIASFQPVSRTLKKNLKRLYASIEEDNEVLQPIVVSFEDGVIADGHRRLACAIMLKLQTVPVRVLKGHAKDLFVKLNGPMSPINNKTWGEAVALGLPPSVVPVEGRWIQRMIDVLGWEDYQVLALAGVTSFICKTAESTSRYVGNTSDEYVGKIIRWMYNLKMQRPVIDAMKANADPNVIKAAIDSNRKLTATTVWLTD